jgi:hypothetical protein
MARSGGGTDGSGVIAGLGGGDGAWPQPGGWFEQGPAQVLHQAQATGGPAPAAGGPVQDGPDQGEAAGLAGQPAAWNCRAAMPVPVPTSRTSGPGLAATIRSTRALGQGGRVRS